MPPATSRSRGCSPALSPAIGAALVATTLSGTRDYVETAWALQADALMEHPQATLHFANQYRGFALAYTWAAGAVGARWSRLRRRRSLTGTDRTAGAVGQTPGLAADR